MPSPHRIVVLAFPLVQLLDIIGIVEVFAEANRQADKRGRPNAYSVELAGPKAGPPETSSGVPFCASMGFDDIDAEIDTLIFGSGAGARAAARAAAENASVVALLRSLRSRPGAWLLDGRHATTGLVSDRGLAATGLLDRVMTLLPPGTPTFLDVPPDPTETAVRAGLAALRAAGADGIVAVGGGSPIDLAKGVGLLATHDGSREQHAAIFGGGARIRPDIERGASGAISNGPCGTAMVSRRAAR